MSSIWPDYDEYHQKKTEREIPVVVLGARLTGAECPDGARFPVGVGGAG